MHWTLSSMKRRVNASLGYSKKIFKIISFRSPIFFSLNKHCLYLHISRNPSINLRTNRFIVRNPHLISSYLFAWVWRNKVMKISFSSIIHYRFHTIWPSEGINISHISIFSNIMDKSICNFLSH